MFARGSIESKLARTDPALGRVIAAVIRRIGVQRLTRSGVSPFEALVRAVVYQSISGKAAASIFARLKQAVGSPLTPAKIAVRPVSALTGIGVSSAKERTIRSLAKWFTSNARRAKTLPALPDEKLVETLTAIPGIGAWTTNVYLIFSLARPDVMPAADLGIRRGVQLIDRLSSPATPRRVIERSLEWRPYRSVASIYLWQAVKLKLRPSDLEADS